MKRIIVGRSTDCDIVIPDDTDNVSRQHLVVAISFSGKIKISDTSSNGTYINERRMLKGTSIPVTKNDTVRLGDNWVLDWDLIPDPYRKTRLGVLFASVLLFLIIIGSVVFFTLKEKENVESHDPLHIDEMENREWNADSTAKHAPVEESIPVDKYDVSKNRVK